MSESTWHCLPCARAGFRCGIRCFLTLVRPDKDNLIEDNGSIMYGKTIFKTTPVHGRTLYHLYFDPARKDKVIASFMHKLTALKDELEADKLIESHRAMYDWYFIVKNTPLRGRSVNYNDEAIQEFINSDSCYWVLIWTSAKTESEVLE